MAEKRLRILLVILAVFGILFVAGCEKAVEEPPPASDVRAMDLPGDDGTTAMIQWRHYAASPAQRYEVLRGETESEVDVLIAEISAQISIPALDTSHLNDFTDKEFYLVLDESTDPPSGHVVEATAETKDSISKIGEHIEKVELSVAPPALDDLPLKFIDADVYRVKPVEKMLTEPQLKKINGMALAESGDCLVPSNGDNTLSLKISNRERAFIENGRVLRDLQGPNEDLIRKYGIGVYSVVTKTTRYATKFNTMRAMDNDTSHAIEPGKKYYYKVRSYSKAKEGVDSKIVDVTPVNDQPTPPQIAGAMYDHVSGDLIVNWMTGDRDLTEVKLWTTTPDDTLAQSGKGIASVNASWNSVKVENIVRDSTQMFYISVSDGESETRSSLFQATPVDFEEISLPKGLRLADHPNDEGLALDIFWEPPAIALNFDITAQVKERVAEDVRANLYFYEDQVVEFTDSVPDDAQQVIANITDKEGDRFDLTVRYDIMANTPHNAAFATINLKGHGLEYTETDYDELGKVVFADLTADEYTVSASLKNANGFEYDNPESKVEQQITINHSGTQEHPPDLRMYQIYRAMADDGAPEKSEFELYTQVPGSYREYIDRWTKDEEGLYREATSHKYAYFMRAMGVDGNFVDSDILGPLKPKSNLFNTKKTIVALFIGLFLLFAGYYLVQGRRGREYFIRPIAGITHIDEALGRATEMGKPILYVMGLGTIGDLSTLASMTILGRVAKKSAEYQNRLIVPSSDPIVMLVAQETVRSAYIDAGRPDAYSENDIYYITSSQFSYAAAVSGIMMREKTATHFFMGWFAAESLILSEAGAMTGAIQISGTDAVSQLPFFITSCDYTLMGEELYAASAYMSGDPIQISSLKIQDSLKAIYALLMLLGTVALSANILWFVNLFKVNLEQ